jgi:RNA polymerase sigma-70 factor (ECF subfamily)
VTTTPGSSRRPAANVPPAAPVPPSDAADQALVRAIQSGDPRAWSRLIALYQDRLFAVCLRMVNDRDAAADLTQDTFVKVIQGLGSYDGRSKLSTWLIRIAMNTCLSWKRSQKLRRHISLDGPPSHRGHADGLGTQGRSGRSSWELRPDQGVELHEQHDRVAAALASLNAEQKAILVLRDVQGLDYDQIAQVLDIAVGTVKSRLFRARLALRETLEGRRPPDPSQ